MRLRAGRFSALVAFAALAGGIACSGESPTPDSAATGSTPQAQSAAARGDTAAVAATTTDSASAKPACASEGTWQQCSIEKRLTDAGFVPIAKGPAATGVFDIAGTQYALGPAELHVYIFPSAKDRATAAAAIDTVTVTRGAGPSPWAMQPTFISSNNLIAVLLSDNGRLIERVQLAITAGLPNAAQ